MALLLEMRLLSWRGRVVGSLMLRSGGGRGRRSRGGDRLGMEAVVLVPSCMLSDVLETSFRDFYPIHISQSVTSTPCPESGTARLW